MEHVTFVTPMPGNAAEQALIEAVVRGGLEGIRGPWTVSVVRGTAWGWWVVTAFRRTDDFYCAFFVSGPSEQNPDFVRRNVVNALQVHLLES